MADPAINFHRMEPTVDRLMQKLAYLETEPAARMDPEVAPLFPGYPFATRLMSGITPIERNGPLDFTVDRPQGLQGWSLLLTIKGQGEVFANAAPSDLLPGDVLLLPPRFPQRHHRHPVAGLWWHRWIYFQPKPSWIPWLVWQRNENGSYLLRRQDDDLYDELERLFAEIAGWSFSGGIFSTDMAFNLLERVVLLCSRYQHTLEQADSRLSLACSFMSENLYRSFSLADVARYAHLSESRLSHLFRSTFGKSVMRWRDDLRIQLACRLLRLSDTPVKQVAAQAGYDDPLNFSRIFRKRLGISPSRFRNDAAARME